MAPGIAELHRLFNDDAEVDAKQKAAGVFAEMIPSIERLTRLLDEKPDNAET